MGKYELLYIVHPDLESSIDKITDRIRTYIESRGGKITYEENWGKRKLAYVISKTDVGIYILWYFEAPKDALSKVERDLRLTEEVIRYMLLAIEEKKKKTVKAKKKEVIETIETVEEKGKVDLEPKAVKTAVKAKIPTKKATIKKKEIPVKEESEEERMKMLDEKLGAILGDESDNIEKSKETK